MRQHVFMNFKHPIFGKVKVLTMIYLLYTQPIDFKFRLSTTFLLPSENQTYIFTEAEFFPCPIFKISLENRHSQKMSLCGFVLKQFSIINSYPDDIEVQFCHIQCRKVRFTGESHIVGKSDNLLFHALYF